MVGRSGALNILTKPPFERAGKTAGTAYGNLRVAAGNFFITHT